MCTAVVKLEIISKHGFGLGLNHLGLSKESSVLFKTFWNASDASSISYTDFSSCLLTVSSQCEVCLQRWDSLEGHKELSGEQRGHLGSKGGRGTLILYPKCAAVAGTGSQHQLCEVSALSFRDLGIFLTLTRGKRKKKPRRKPKQKAWHQI